MDRIIDYLGTEFSLTGVEKAKLKYSLDVLFTDLSKIIILIIPFYIIGELDNFMYSVLALFVIRPFTGGLHFKTYIGCFLFTFFFFLSVIILNNIMPLEYSGIYLMVFSCIIILCTVPITHKNRLRYSSYKRWRFKSISLLIITLHLILYLLAMKNPYLNIAIWVITLQSIQLLIRKVVDFYEKTKLEETLT